MRAHNTVMLERHIRFFKKKKKKGKMNEVGWREKGEKEK